MNINDPLSGIQNLWSMIRIPDLSGIKVLTVFYLKFFFVISRAFDCMMCLGWSKFRKRFRCSRSTAPRTGGHWRLTGNKTMVMVRDIDIYYIYRDLWLGNIQKSRQRYLGFFWLFGYYSAWSLFSILLLYINWNWVFFWELMVCLCHPLLEYLIWFKRNLLSVSLMLSIFKEKTVHTFIFSI